MSLGGQRRGMGAAVGAPGLPGFWPLLHQPVSLTGLPSIENLCEDLFLQYKALPPGSHGCQARFIITKTLKQEQDET